MTIVNVSVCIVFEIFFREVQLKVADHNEKLKIMQRVNTGGKSKKTTAKTAATKGTDNFFKNK